MEGRICTTVEEQWGRMKVDRKGGFVLAIDTFCICLEEDFLERPVGFPVMLQ